MKSTSLVQVRRSIKGFHSRGALCETCGIRSECHRSLATTCEQYIPVLKFRDLRGTEGRFATFRSPAWGATLKVGDDVMIGGNTIVRRARVVGVYSGSRDDMERRFGSISHLSIGKDFDLEEFRKARRRQIGPRLYWAMTNVSVIILE
jgi:hypothetical protein